MPSYIIHYICGNKLLDDYQINTKEKNLFLAANLIPDTSKVLGNIETASSKGNFRKNNRSIIQQEKLTTHFRDSKDSENIYMFPNLEKFKEKYGINDLTERFISKNKKTLKKLV